MDGSRFDQLARALARPHSRRAVITALAGSALGGISARLGPSSAFAQTATPTAPLFDTGSVIFSDDFESGTLKKWNQVQGVIVERTDVAHGHYAAEATSTGAAAFARTKLDQVYPELYARVRFKVVRRDAGVYLLQFFTDASTSLIGVYLTDQGKLGFRNDVAGQDAHSSTTVSSGQWHELQGRLQAAARGHVEIWLDGTKIQALNQPAALGTTPIGRFQIGESATGDTFTVAFDDIVVATQFIPSTYPSAAASPTASTTPAASAQSGAAPAAPTPTTSAPAAACQNGQTGCGGVCVTLSSDARNCGGCGVTCAPGHICLSGSCVTAGCPTGQIACGADYAAPCVDLQTDPNNCGTCFTVCGQGQTCSGGVCTGSGQSGACPGGCGQDQACCNGSCVTLGDEANCAACGNACSQGQVCCSSAIGCIDPSSDPNNCGNCGNACSQGQTCANGTCTGGATTCPAGQANCGSGCVDLGDESNCSACGDACGQGQVCCSSATGCVDTSSDPNNCGNCGNACGQGQTCTGGTCSGGATSCPAGQADCGSGCVPLGDEANCGGCGDACGQGQVCCNGSCQTSC